MAQNCAFAISSRLARGGAIHDAVLAKRAANRLRLTDMFVKSVKPNPKRTLYWDLVQKGLALTDRGMTRDAQALGEIKTDVDPELFAFQLESFVDSANWTLDDPVKQALVRRAVRGCIENAASRTAAAEI